MRDSALTRSQRRDARDTFYPVRREGIRYDPTDDRADWKGVISGAIIVLCILAAMWIVGH